MRIEPFGVEQWMNAHETSCTYNLAETCVASLQIEELLVLAGRNADALADLLPLKMTYGDITGSPRLRRAVAALYDKQDAGNVLITHGTIGANALVHRTLVGPGDRVVSIVPTYQQHTAIPASIGAEVQELRLRAGDGYLPDLDALAALATPGTRLITLTNPNNPTGALIDRAGLERVASIARAAGAWVLCDEVYRGTDQEGPGATAAMADIYERGISTGGMSKAFALAGLRLGWIVGPEELLSQVEVHRDYDTIAVGRIDDHLAALALEARDRVLGRSRDLVKRNLAILADWVAAEPGVEWVRPSSATICLLRYGLDMGSEEFCLRLMEAEGVLFTPGAVFGEEGTVRIGYANDTEILRAGLARVSAFLKSLPGVRK